MRRTLVVGLALAVVLTAFAPRAAAAVPRPTYTTGDSWTYRRNLTEAFNLKFSGNTTLEAGAVVPFSIDGVHMDALELYASGGGTFSGAFPGFGSVRGNWTATGTDWWEAGSWKMVRSVLRLSADGLLSGGVTAVPVTFELRNDTTARVLDDGWPWPIPANATGFVTSRWNTTQNLTVVFGTLPPQYNEIAVTADLTTGYAWNRTERVTVPAGTFDADVIREAGPEGGFRLHWYSARAGNDVREEEYNSTGAKVLTSELTAYHYAAGQPTPGFPWLLVLVATSAAVVVVLLVVWALRSRQRRNPIEPWMPPEPPGSS